MEIHQETPLNIDFGINNERQDYKTSIVCGEVFVGGERVSGGDEGEGIWLIGCIYIYIYIYIYICKRTIKLLAIL
jgi:hypothetical protein